MDEARDCQGLWDSYCRWLHESALVHGTEDGCAIVTPYTGPDGDCLEILVHPSPRGGQMLVLSDGGSSLDYLFLSGIDVSRSDTRFELVASIARTHGVELSADDELYVLLTPGADLGELVGRLIQAILSIQNLVYTGRPSAARTFREEVARFMTDKKIVYQGEYVVSGRTKDHKFDFAVQTKKRLKLLRTLSTNNVMYARQLAVMTAFSYLDIRNKDTEFDGVAILDDASRVWEGEPERVLTEYSTHVICWTNKEALVDVLAA